MNLSSILTYAALLGGWGVSAWIIPGQWGFILLLGVVLGYALTHFLILQVRYRPNPAAAPDSSKWRLGPYSGGVAFLVGCGMVLLWVLFGTGDVDRIRPGLAAGMVNTTGILLGLTAWLALNFRKMVAQ